MILAITADRAVLIDSTKLHDLVKGAGCQVVTVVPEPSPDQLDGQSCIDCDSRVGVFAPVAMLNGVQLFRHLDGVCS